MLINKIQLAQRPLSSESDQSDALIHLGERRRWLRSAADDDLLISSGGKIAEHHFSAPPAVIKRCVDVVGALIGLFLLSPLFLVVAILVVTTSKGPLFFGQVRVTRGGKQFKMWKFRTMVVGAEKLRTALAAQNEMSGPVFKMKNDPRVTRIGRILRKLSIDELPQLVNVLLGHMSLVGPRPPLPEEVQKYRLWQARRLSVKTGITCLWQVSGRNQISFENWMRLDVKYIQEWSLWLDCRILLKTIGVVLTGYGAS